MYMPLWNIYDGTFYNALNIAALLMSDNLLNSDKIQLKGIFSHLLKWINFRRQYKLAVNLNFVYMRLAEKHGRIINELSI